MSELEYKLIPIGLLRAIIPKSSRIISRMNHEQVAASAQFNSIPNITNNKPTGSKYEYEFVIYESGRSLIEHTLPDLRIHGIDYHDEVLVHIEGWGPYAAYSIYFKTEADLAVARLVL